MSVWVQRSTVSSPGFSRMLKKGCGPRNYTKEAKIARKRMRDFVRLPPCFVTHRGSFAGSATCAGSLKTTTPHGLPAWRPPGWTLNFSGFIARLDLDLVKHILSPQCFSHAFSFELSERMVSIGAGDLKQPIVEHHHAERAKRYAGRDLNRVHVMDFEAAGLFDPILDERVTQGMLGFGFRKIRPLDDETVFAHVASQLPEDYRLIKCEPPVPWARRVNLNYH